VDLQFRFALRHEVDGSGGGQDRGEAHPAHDPPEALPLRRRSEGMGSGWGMALPFVRRR
jgi:hypothetical protein